MDMTQCRREEEEVVRLFLGRPGGVDWCCAIGVSVLTGVAGTRAGEDSH